MIVEFDNVTKYLFIILCNGLLALSFTMYFRLEIKHLTSFHLFTMCHCCLTYLVPETHLKMSVWKKILLSVESLMRLRASSRRSLNEITTCFIHGNTPSERGDKCMQQPFICFYYIDVSVFASLTSITILKFV